VPLKTIQPLSSTIHDHMILTEYKSSPLLNKEKDIILPRLLDLTRYISVIPRIIKVEVKNLNKCIYAMFHIGESKAHRIRDNIITESSKSKTEKNT